MAKAQASDTAQLPASLVARHSVLVDAAIAAAFALATLATRWPVRSRYAFNWDATNFALGVQGYDVRLHHPHPPGYPLFVAAGWLLHRVIPDVNTALVVVAMLLAAGAVAAIYRLGTALFDRATGVVAALFLLVSVTFWTNGAVALAYPSLALFGTLVALFAWRLRGGGSPPPRPPSPRGRGENCRDTAVFPRGSFTSMPEWFSPLPRGKGGRGGGPPLRYSVLLSVAYALGGGFRPDLLLFLAPLWVWGHWRAGWRVRLTGAAVATGIVLAWAVPMVALSGGVDEYLKVLRAYTADDVLRRYSVAENGPRALIVNVRDLLAYTGYALYALALPVVGAAIWLLVAGTRRLLHGAAGNDGSRTATEPNTRPLIALFVLWVAPVLLFYTWLHIGDPGYALSFVPALLLLAARFAVRVPRSAFPIPGATGPRILLAARCSLLAAVLGINTAIFLTRPLTLTAPGIARQDRTVAAKVAYVRAHANPADTLLVSYESYRHWLLYLPEYRVQFVDVTYGTEADRTVALPPGVTRVVLMDDTLLRAAQGVAPTETAAIERDRVGLFAAPLSPVRFVPVASPLGG